MASSTDEEEVERAMDNANSHDHPFWTHVVKAGKTAADMTVDVAAIAGISWMAVSGVEAATLQVVGGMVASIAIGKRYFQNSENRTLNA